MSDSANSAREIEDVLSSVRRLVADAQDRSSVPPAPAAMPDKAQDTARLVLTADQRVAEPTAPDASAEGLEEVVGETPDPELQEDLQTVAEKAEMGRDDIADEDNLPDAAWRPDDRLSDWGDISNMTAGESRDPIERLSDVAEAAPFESETGDTDWPDTSADSAVQELAAVRADGDEADAAEEAEVEKDSDLTQAISDRDDMPEPATPAPKDAEAVALPGEDKAGDAGSPNDMAADDQAGEPAEDLSALADDADPQPDADQAKDQTITPVFSRRVDMDTSQTDQNDPASDMADDEIEDAMEVETTLKAEQPEEDAAEDLGEDSAGVDFPDEDEGILDEDTLRDIIVEVVREELQGALGQRITRNVRKMVRREIRIAMAAEELDNP